MLFCVCIFVIGLVPNLISTNIDDFPLFNAISQENAEKLGLKWNLAKTIFQRKMMCLHYVHTMVVEHACSTKVSIKSDDGHFCRKVPSLRST